MKNTTVQLHRPATGTQEWAASNEVLVVSKPRVACVKRLCAELLPYRDQIVFRFSIGSTDSAVLSFWEPGAPGFEERLECLRIAHISEYVTSVSCEPMLDAATTR